jgi:hypothetical protein
MTEITNELMYNVLKKIQEDVSHIRDRVDDHDQQFIRMREEIHSMRGDVLRVGRSVAEMQVKIDRLERREALLNG